MKVKLALKRCLRRGTQAKKWNICKLKENKADICKKFEDRVTAQPKDMPVQERWTRIKDAISDIAGESIGFDRQVKTKKPWITQGMLDKMEERRRWKNVNSDVGRRKYKELHNALRRETESARKAWWEKECEEMEQLNKKGRSDLVYDRVRKLTCGNKRSGSNAGIESKTGELLTDRDSIKDRWKEYIEELYDKDGKPIEADMNLERETEVEADCVGPELLDEEILDALQSLKEDKAPGIDNIPAEFLKVAGEKMRHEIVRLCKDIYREGEWPSDFTKIVLVPLQKKKNASKCQDHRTISLICHASKIMLKVLTRRIEAKARDFVSRGQYGFRKGRGTRDAVGVMRMISERCSEYGNELYVCFIDFEKAFDKVSWPKMMGILRQLKVDWRDRRLIMNLYMKQGAVVRTAEGETTESTIGQGVRQGCPLSPLLFSIYSEMMMRDAFEELEEGVKIGGVLVKDVRFADDQAVINSTNQGLQEMITKLEETAKEYNMRINEKKTEAMVISKAEGKQVNVTVNGKQVAEVQKFRYLGSWIAADGMCKEEVKCRIGMAKEAFAKRRELMTKLLSLELKKKLVKTLVWSVLLYCCETWTLRTEERRRLEAFEMWVWRKLLKISWKDKVTNEEVLMRVGEKRQLMDMISKRKKNWIGHVLRHDGLMKDVTEGRMEGKRGRGRKRVKMLDDLIGEETYAQLKRRAEDRGRWKVWAP